MKWKNKVERGRPQTIILRMSIACWIPKVTDTHSEYVILIPIPLQQRLHEPATMLRYTYVGHLESKERLRIQPAQLFHFSL